MEERDIKLSTKVLILGSTGLIGHQVYSYLKAFTNFELSELAHTEKLTKSTIQIDALDEFTLFKSIEEICPDYIINCIGILIDKADIEIERTIYLNSLMPHRLRKLADKINSRLIHMSTDCVFSGLKGKSYIESDVKDGKDTYSKTKALGEVISDNHLTLRTSVVGPELKEDGDELFNWFMKQTGVIRGYTDVYWSGVSTFELAKAVNWSIVHNISGLYHVTNNKKISKNDLLILFRKYTNKDIDIIPSSSKKIDKSFIDTRLLIDYKIPNYDQMISDMVKLITNNEMYFQNKANTF